MSKLKDRRESYGLTQAQLADRVPGLSLRALQSYEQGWRSIRKAPAAVVIGIAKVLRCRPEQIIG